MDNDRRYQGIMARAGRGRYGLIRRRVIEVNLLVIGALLFVGFGIVSLRSDTDRTVMLKRMEPRSTQPGSVSENELPFSNGRPAVRVSMVGGEGPGAASAVLEAAQRNQPFTRSSSVAFASGMVDIPGDGAGPVGRDTRRRWVRSAHPLAAPVPLDRDGSVSQFLPTTYAVFTTPEPDADRPSPLVRLDTRTGQSPFWYAISALCAVAFATGFWNSRKAHNR